MARASKSQTNLRNLEKFELKLLLTVDFAVSAVNRPVVVAVVVHSAFSVEQQTIFARFQCQSSVRAEEELIAMIWMFVGVFAMRIRARWSGSGWKKQRIPCQKHVNVAHIIHR
jgi:hypothetical protein